MAQYLLAASPVHGHVSPMLAIGEDLVRRGHEVRLLTGARFASAAAAAGVKHVALPGACDYDDRDMDAAFPARRATRGLARARFDMDLLFTGPIAHQHRALAGALTVTPADAVLVDIGFTGALPLLLGRHPRPPVLACGVVPLMLSSRDTTPFGMAWMPQRTRLARLRQRSQNVAVHGLLFRANQARANRTLRELGVGELPVFVMDWPRLADHLLQLTVPGFEYPRSDLPPTVTFAGPVLPAAPAGTALPEWWDDLAAGRPVVHVTQGTLDNGDLDRLVGPTVRALAEEDVLVVVSTGGRPAAAVPGPVPANVRIAEFLPYEKLLPRVDVMVTNGGYGGVHYALAHGVPLVVAGGTEEKPEIAARVQWSGAGIDLRTGTPTPRSVRAAVRTVLSGPGHREHARRLRAEIAAARPLDTVAAGLAQAATAG